MIVVQIIHIRNIILNKIPVRTLNKLKTKTRMTQDHNVILSNNWQQQEICNLQISEVECDVLSLGRDADECK